MPCTDPPHPRPPWQATDQLSQRNAADDGAEHWGYEAAMPYLLVPAAVAGDEGTAAGPTGLRS